MKLSPYFVIFKVGHGVQFNGTYPLLTTQTVVESKGVVMVFGTSQQDAEDVATYHLGEAWDEVQPFEDFCLTRSFLQYFPTGIATIPPDWRHKGCEEHVDSLPVKPCQCVVCKEEFEKGESLRMFDCDTNSWDFAVTIDEGFQRRFMANPDKRRRAHSNCLYRLAKNGFSVRGLT